MGVANLDEKQRNAAIAAQAKADVWRATGPVTAWEPASLAQAQADPWYQTDYERFHANTMATAASDEVERKAAVAAQAKSDKWRATGPVTPWEKAYGTLVQTQDDPWYQKDMLAGHKVVMERADNDEAARVAAVNGQ